MTVVVEDPREWSRLPRLVDGVGETDLRLVVDVPRSFERVKPGDRFVRVEEEWIAFSRVEGRELVVERFSKARIESRLAALYT